jgi:hypothetical protein
VTHKTQKKLEDQKNIDVKDTHMTWKGKNKIKIAYDIEDTITPPNQ